MPRQASKSRIEKDDLWNAFPRSLNMKQTKLSALEERVDRKWKNIQQIFHCKEAGHVIDLF